MTRQQKSGIFLSLLGVTVFFVIPFQVESTSSAVYPRIVSVLMAVFGILVTVLGKKTEDRDDVNMFDPLLLLYMLLVLAAVVMIQFVGFYPVIVVTLPLCLYLFGERNFKKIIPFTLITTAVIYVCIDYILGSMLP